MNARQYPAKAKSKKRVPAIAPSRPPEPKRPCSDCEAPEVEVNGEHARLDSELDSSIGSGGTKVVFGYRERQGAIGVLKTGRRDAIEQEIRVLDKLRKLNLPVVAVAGPLHVVGFKDSTLSHPGDRCRPAIEYAKIYACDSKSMVRMQKGRVVVQAGSLHFGPESLASLSEIRKRMVQGRIFVNDLQFLVDDDGSFVLADALDTKVRTEGPSKTNMHILDTLIELAKLAKGGS
jgi:hypothetical protein